MFHFFNTQKFFDSTPNQFQIKENNFQLNSNLMHQNIKMAKKKKKKKKEKLLKSYSNASKETSLSRFYSNLILCDPKSFQFNSRVQNDI